MSLLLTKAAIYLSIYLLIDWFINCMTLWLIEISKELKTVFIIVFFYNTNVFTVTFDQFITFLVNTINIFVNQLINQSINQSIKQTSLLIKLTKQYCSSKWKIKESIYKYNFLRIELIEWS